VIGLDELKEFLNITGNESDELLEQLEQSAVSIIETWQGITYPAAGQQVEYIRGPGASDLYLQFRPSADPTQVLERDDVGAAGTAITDWVRRGNFLVRKGSALWRIGSEYQVTYQGGYDLDEPGNVRQAVKSVVALLFQRRGGELLQSETIGPYSYTLSSTSISAQVTDICISLGLHRMLVVS